MNVLPIALSNDFDVEHWHSTLNNLHSHLYYSHQAYQVHHRDGPVNDQLIFH